MKSRNNNSKIDKRLRKQKDYLLEQLARYPIIQVASERSGISRATYYRWREEDMEFAELADKALSEGLLLINDLAESKLIGNIQNGHTTSLIFWLKNHHKGYSDRIIHEYELKEKELTREEKMKIIHSIHMAGFANTLKLNETESEEIVEKYKREIEESEKNWKKKLSSGKDE